MFQLYSGLTRTRTRPWDLVQMQIPVEQVWGGAPGSALGLQCPQAEGPGQNGP